MIVRGFIIPIRGEDDRPTSTYTISSKESKTFYTQYKNMVSYLLQAFTRANNGSLRDARDVNAFLNFMVLFIRSSLYRDTIPDVVPAVAGQVHRYYLEQYLKVKNGQELDITPGSYFTWLRDERAGKKVPEEEQALADCVMDILKFPADDRPGANTSSLLIHALTVSGIAACKYLASDVKADDVERELAVLRLACLFHDLGKFSDWSKHEEIAANDVKDLFGKFVEGSAIEVVDEAASLIPRESQAATHLTKLRKLYVESDIAASGIDRITEHFLKMLSDDLKDMLLDKARKYLKDTNVDEEIFVKKCYLSWDFWHEYVSLEEKKRLTEDFCKHAVILSGDNPLLAMGVADARSGLEGVHVARIDIRDIQGSIKVNDLRAVAGGSMNVDFAVFVAIPLTLILKNALPAEVIFFNGGGNVTVVLPDNQVRAVLKRIENEIRDKCGLRLTAASYPIQTSFTQTTRGIEAELAKKKLSEDEYLNELSDMQPYQLNIFDLCDACGRRSPQKQVDGKLFCKKCFEMHMLGGEFHFVYKLVRLDYPWQDLNNFLQFILEYIAGSSKDEIIQRKFTEYKNLAVLRIDANIAGAFIGSSVSITDAFERSIRMDWALKKSYHDFLQMVKKIDKNTYDRLVLGTIYIGGDDAFLLAPSRIAPYLACFLINEFFLEMGSMLTLSCGLAVAKPKHPLMPLYEAAGYLLDEVVKKNVRKTSYTLYGQHALDERRIKEFRGALAFYTVDGGFVTPEGLKDGLMRLYDMMVSKQLKEPYIISEPGQAGAERSLLGLLQIVSTAIHGSGARYSLFGLKDAMKLDLEELLKGRDASEKVKSLITTIKRDVNVALLGDSSINLQVVFAKRQAERLEDKRELISLILKTLELRGTKIRIGLADALLLAKVVLGE